MSYRALSNVCWARQVWSGKCRFLFGAFILLLITSSFWLYAHLTESLAYDQLTTTCRLLVIQIVDKQLATGCRPLTPAGRPADTAAKVTEQALDEFRDNWGRGMPGALQDYRFSKITRDTKPEQMPSDNYSLQRLKEFLADDDKARGQATTPVRWSLFVLQRRPGIAVLLPRLSPRTATSHQRTCPR